MVVFERGLKFSQRNSTYESNVGMLGTLTSQLNRRHNGVFFSEGIKGGTDWHAFRWRAYRHFLI